MVTSMVGWMFSFSKDFSYNSWAIWSQFGYHYGDNSDDESYPPSQNRQMRRFANHSTTYKTHRFPHSVANATKLQQRILYRSLTSPFLLLWLKFVTENRFWDRFSSHWWYHFGSHFWYRFGSRFWYRFGSLFRSFIWFSLQNNDINIFEGSKFGTDLVPDFGPSDYNISFDFLKSILLFRILLNIFSVTCIFFSVRICFFSLAFFEWQQLRG